MSFFRLAAPLAIAAALIPATAAIGQMDFRSTVKQGLPAPWTAMPRAHPKKLQFAIIGDNTGLARPGVFDAAMRQISWLSPEMVMSVGDLVEGYTEDTGEIAQEWKGIEASIAKAEAPFFYVAGNHDLGNDTALQYWRSTRGEPYYAFVYKGALFLVLDSEDPPKPLPDQKQFRDMLKLYQRDPKAFADLQRDNLAKVNAHRAEAAKDGKGDWMTELNKSRFSDRQVEFVRQALARYKDVRWTFVFMHKPGWKADDGNFPKIEAMLADRKYTMIAGHYHYYEHIVRNGHDYIAMGTTGGSSHQEGAGKMDHIAWVTLDEGAPRIAMVKLSGVQDREGKTGQPDSVF